MQQRIDIAFRRLVLSDALVAKAAGLSEVAQIARLEARSREYLGVHWRALSQQATAGAATRAAKGASAGDVAKFVDKTMARWAPTVSKTFAANMSTIYRLAFTAGGKKAIGAFKGSLQYDGQDLVAKAKPKPAIAPSFSLEDKDVVAALEERNIFWLGEHYGENVSAGIAAASRNTLVAGLPRREAQAAIKRVMAEELGKVATPEGYTGTAASYFEGVAANAATVARSFGQMSSFAAAGITKYVIVNPLDERTCPVCGHMEGKEFFVKDGTGQIEDELSASSPEEVKAKHPWLSAGALLKISPKPGKVGRSDAKRLAGAGLSLPPYHFRCRCVPDIA